MIIDHVHVLRWRRSSARSWNRVAAIGAVDKRKQSRGPQCRIVIRGYHNFRFSFKVFIDFVTCQRRHFIRRQRRLAHHSRPVGRPRACPSPCLSDNTPFRLFILYLSSIFHCEVGQGPPTPSVLCPCRERTLRRRRSSPAGLLCNYYSVSSSVADVSRTTHRSLTAVRALIIIWHHRHPTFQALCSTVCRSLPIIYFPTVNGSRPTRPSPRIPISRTLVAVADVRSTRPSSLPSGFCFLRK